MEFNFVEIILAVIAILGSVVTHLLTKRKYNGEIDKLKAETDSDNIDNMDKSLDFYEKLTESTNKRLDEVLKNQESIVKENTQLKGQVANINSKIAQLMAIVCTKLTCAYREIDNDIVKCVYPEKEEKDD
jgi:predicted  nucleic acid-binding Zn-ribbon protein